MCALTFDGNLDENQKGEGYFTLLKWVLSKHILNGSMSSVLAL